MSRKDDLRPTGKLTVEAKVRAWYKAKDKRINVKYPGIKALKKFKPHEPEYAIWADLLKQVGHWPAGAIEPIKPIV